MSKDMLGIAVRKLVTLPEGVLGTVCDLLEKLSDPDWILALKRFLRKENPWQTAGPKTAERQADFFTPILDANLPEEYQAIVAKYRQLATEQGIPATHPVCYRVRAGFTLKRDAPLAGSCYDNFKYLQDWKFSDEPTQDGYVFWVPGVLQGSVLKNVGQQRQFLTETRTRLGLPAHHLSGFGSVALVAGLILAYFKATGERISLELRTDTCGTGGRRLSLYWHGGSINCEHWYGDDDSSDNVGVPALGAELRS